MIALKPSMRMRALGRLPKGHQNKTEAAYEDRVLKPAMMAGLSYAHLARLAQVGLAERRAQ